MGTCLTDNAFVRSHRGPSGTSRTRGRTPDPALTRSPERASFGTDALFERLRRTGDPVARDELVNRFMPLARKLASRYTNPSEPLEDLVQVAAVGLLGAIDRFDPGRGVAFTSFAIPTMLGELKRHFRNTGWTAHVPRRAQELAMRVDKATREISTRTGQAPSVMELCQHLELSPEDVLTGLDAGQAHYSISLDAPCVGPGDDEPEPLASTFGAEDERFALADTRLSLLPALRQLPRPERTALALRLSCDLKQIEIAELLGCSQMQVSRLLRRGAARLVEISEAQ